MTIQRSVAFDLSEEEYLNIDYEKKDGEVGVNRSANEIIRENKEIVGILKPPNPKKELKSFPSLPECFLRDLGLIEKGPLLVQDIEYTFSSLSLAFKTDHASLQERMEFHQRQRDIAERNLEEELRHLKTSIGTLNRMCRDSETREVLERVSKQIHVLKQSSGRVSSSAGAYGAVQQESRIATAIEIMHIHVDNLKRIYEKEHHELEESRRILVKHKLFLDDPKTNLLEDKASPTARNRSVSVMQSSSCAELPKSRKASMSSSVQKQIGTSYQDSTTKPQNAFQNNSIRKIGISAVGSRYPPPDEASKNIKTESAISHFKPIQEHVEDGKDEETKNVCADDSNVNGAVCVNSSVKKRQARKSSNPFFKEGEETTIFEEIDFLAKKRDSSPILKVMSLSETAQDLIQRKRSLVVHLKEWYSDFYWPYDQGDTALGVRYCVAAILLIAAFLVMTVTFLGDSSKQGIPH